MALSVARAGEVAAPPSFAELYRETFAVVWRTLGRLGVAQSALDDACQEVFVVVHRRLGEFAQRSSARTWVVGIAIRVAADHRRAARRRPASEQLDERLPDPAETPLERVSRDQERELVYRLLGRLPDEQREVLVLTEMEQLTAPEISEALGVNLNTVYSRLRLARRAFDAALEAWQSGAGR